MAFTVEASYPTRRDPPVGRLSSPCIPVVPFGGIEGCSGRTSSGRCLTRIVLPLVRVADLALNGAEFLQRLLLRFVTIQSSFWIRSLPRPSGSTPAHRPSSWLPAEILGNIHLAECVADHSVGHRDHAFPAWLDLFLAVHELVVEAEVFHHERVAEDVAGVIQHIPLEVDFPVVQRT